jgi:hypothetical protein
LKAVPRTSIPDSLTQTLSRNPYHHNDGVEALTRVLALLQQLEKARPAAAQPERPGLLQIRLAVGVRALDVITRLQEMDDL